MSLTDRVIQIIELVLLCLCLIATEFYSLRAKNLEKQLKAEKAALRYEMQESVEKCNRIAYTCIDVMNRKILEGADYEE